MGNSSEPDTANHKFFLSKFTEIIVIVLTPDFLLAKLVAIIDVVAIVLCLVS